MLSRPMSLLLAAVVIGMTCCLPMIQAGSCSSGYCATPPVYHAPACAPPVLHQEVPVFVSPFEPLDVFVFVGVAQPSAVAVQAPPPAGGQITESQDFRISGKPEPAPAFPKASGWFGKPADAPEQFSTNLGRVKAALTSCAGCHTAPAGKKGINIFASNGAFDPKVSPAAILASVESDSMPLRGAKLTPAQKKVIADWATSTASKGT